MNVNLFFKKNIQLVLRAMQFDIPEEMEVRQMNARNLFCKLFDRLSEQDLKKFQYQLEQIKYSVQNIYLNLEVNIYQQTKLPLESEIIFPFQLMYLICSTNKQKVKILDLIPDALKVNFQEIDYSQFQDNLALLDESAQLEQKSNLLERKYDQLSPVSIPIAARLNSLDDSSRKILSEKNQPKIIPHKNLLINHLDLVKIHKTNEAVVDFEQEDQQDNLYFQEQKQFKPDKYNIHQFLNNLRDLLKVQELQKLKQFKLVKDSKLDKIVNFEQKKLELKKSQYKFALKSQLVIINQANVNQNIKEKSNYVYCFGFPYDLQSHPSKVLSKIYIIQDVKINFQTHIQEKIGNFKSIQFFDFRQFRQIQMQKQEIRGSLGLEVDKNMMFSQKLLERIECKKKQKMNKSYAIIEFNTQEQKQAFLHDDLRFLKLIIMQDFLIQCEDADFKKTIVLNNIPWGVEVWELIGFLKNKLEGTFTVNIDKDAALQASFVVLRCNTFQDTLKAQQILNNQSFKKCILKVNHFPGNIRSIQGEKFEDLDIIETGTKFRAEQQKLNLQRWKLLSHENQLNISDREQDEIIIQMVNYEFPGTNFLEPEIFNEEDFKEKLISEQKKMLLK